MQVFGLRLLIKFQFYELGMNANLYNFFVFITEKKSEMKNKVQ